mmetsp:Transcript_125738/g.350304  ORF Transcript_125738/g.350304 Transcript_125738/m.350304 type:complete len:347 (-) Transcript_125738:49-1089(-)
MAVMLPQLPRGRHSPQPREPPLHAGRSTSLPALPQVTVEEAPQLLPEMRHVHRHYHILVSSPPDGSVVPPSPGKVPAELLHGPSGCSSSSSWSAAPQGKVLDTTLRTSKDSMNTAELLLEAELPPAVSCSPSGRCHGAGARAQQEDSPQHRHSSSSRSRAKGSGGGRCSPPGRRLHVGKCGAASETQQQWDRYVSLSEAARPSLGRPPRWHPRTDGDYVHVEQRMRELDAEGRWLQHRAEFRRKIKDLPDSAASNMKRKLVGDPRLRKICDRSAIEKVKQEDIERNRHAARVISGAIQECSKSRQQLKSMQMLLRSVGDDESVRRRKAAVEFLRGEVPEVTPEDTP